MTTEQLHQTPRDRQLEQTRCGVCGLTHPFLTVCPFIAEREVRIEFGIVAGGQRRMRTRIERTSYFPRPELFKALEEATTAAAAEAPKEKLTRVKRRKY